MSEQVSKAIEAREQRKRRASAGARAAVTRAANRATEEPKKEEAKS